MSIWWCRGCGMEETRQRDSCPSCGSALSFSTVDWLEAGSRGEETVWELLTEPLERAAIVDGLLTAGIAHRWDTPKDLVAPEDDEPAVDAILDEVLGAEDESDADESDSDESEAEASDEEPAEGEDDGYRLISDLYIATDRVLKSGDELDVLDFGQIVGATLVATPPFGVDDEKWADIQAAARNSVAALEQEEDEDSADPLLHELKSLLQEMV